jgi:hypothetical protein
MFERRGAQEKGKKRKRKREGKRSSSYVLKVLGKSCLNGMT